MAHYRGLSIAVLSGKDALPMYDDPEMDGDGDPNEVIRYIEATTGAKFELHVTLDSSFAWDQSNTVRITVVYDGARSAWCQSISRASPPTNGAGRYLVKFDTVPRWCQSSQKWKVGFLSFGALEASTLSRSLKRDYC